MVFDLHKVKDKLSVHLKSKKFTATLLVVVIVAVLSAASGIIFSYFSERANINAGAYAENVSAENCSTYEGKEMRGVWVATVANINFPSRQNLTVDEMKAELDDIVKTTKEANLNAIFFQVRPAADALYKSDIFPWSVYLTGEYGKAPDGGFDPLTYIIEKAHQNNIELHAWINPYRVTSGTADKPKHSTAELAENSPARLHPEYCVAYADGKLYFNPGIPEVRALTVDGVRELVKNYPELDGIHFDDYFYPYPVAGATFDDSKEYALYGNGLSLDNWRRLNVNMLLLDVYNAIKEIHPGCAFGVSPFGIWANSTSSTPPVVGSETKGLESYFSIYCDPLAWVNGGYVDYIAPQVYWSFNTSVAPFDTIAKWWNAQLDGKNVALYIGHAAYKAKDFGESEIPMQVEFARNLLSYKGSIFYGYADIKANTANLKNRIAALNENSMVYSKVPSTGEEAKINFPSDGFSTDGKTVYCLGSSDPAYPVSIAGQQVSRTKGGYFSVYTNLSSGENRLEFMQNGKILSHSIVKVAAVSPDAAALPKMEITECTPNTETWVGGGDTINFSCVAPAGSTVTANIGGMKASLKPTLNPKGMAKYLREVYTGSITFDSLAKAGEIIDLGTLKFTATKENESTTERAALLKQVGTGAYIYAEVTKDYAYLKKSPTSSFYNDYLPASKGMRDYVTGLENGYYRLKFGGYISTEDVTFVKGQPLYENRLISTALEVMSKDGVNYDRSTTDLRLGVLENVPVNVTVTDNLVKIFMYNTDPSFIPPVQVVGNPLIESVEGSKDGDTSVLYTVKLKNAENFYGFRVVYENGMLIIKFNDPLTLADGDKPLSGKTIIVDAGHGGTDIGARGPSSPQDALYESKLNLNIANILADKLTALGADVRTVRTEDTTVSIYDRLDFISKVVPDLLISVHHNSVAESVNATKARGFLGLYSNNSGIMLAKTVSARVCSDLGRFERATSYQMLAMVRDHRFPSALLEMSFISNVEEFQWTITEGNYERSAQAIVNGIFDFYGKQAQYLNY